MSRLGRRGRGRNRRTATQSTKAAHHHMATVHPGCADTLAPRC